MHVLVDGLLLSQRPSGIGNYILHLVKAMAPQVGPRDRLTLVVPRDLDVEGLELSCVDRLEIFKSPVPCNAPLRRILWEQVVLPNVARRLGATAIFGPAYALPLRTRIPGVVTVHDLAFLRYDNVHPPLNRRYLAWITRASVQRAHQVIAVSKSTKEELVSLLGVPPAKIRVIYNGVAPNFRPVPPHEGERVRERYNLPEHYILYVGNIEPRKNLPVLLEAFDKLKQDASIPHRLVILGQRGWLEDAVDAALKRLAARDQVLFTGYIPADALPAIYSLADVFVYPSRYEGFGLPVLEAMACGTPVVTSNVSSLPEVAGDAAELVQPGSVDSVAGAIRRLVCDREHREKLAARGRQRAAMFSWDHAARLTLMVFRDAVGTRRRT